MFGALERIQSRISPNRCYKIIVLVSADHFGQPIVTSFAGCLPPSKLVKQTSLFCMEEEDHALAVAIILAMWARVRLRNT